MSQEQNPKTKTETKRKQTVLVAERLKLRRHETKPGVCQECGRLWKRTNDQDGSILGTCPECRIKKRLFSRLKLL